jgi:hypothetical protein
MPVALFGNRTQAEPAQQRLVQAGFAAEIVGEVPLQKLWFVSRRSAGVTLEVAAAQFEAAERKLLDWDAVDGSLRDAIRCPQCKSLRVEYPQFTRRSLLTNLVMGLAAGIGLVEKDYYCEDCHFTWPKEGNQPRRVRRHMPPYYFIEDVEEK